MIFWHAEALHLALQQQTLLAQSGCTLEVASKPRVTRLNQATPSPALPTDAQTGTTPNLAGTTRDPASTASVVDSPTLGQVALAGPFRTAPAGSNSPLLTMGARGANLLVVSVQLKTGYLRINCGEGLIEDIDMTQLLKQVGRSTRRDISLRPIKF